MRAAMLKNILSELKASSADIDASAITTTDGLVLASQLPLCVDSRFATLLSLGVQSAQSAARGSLEQVLIKTKEGLIMLSHASADTVLAVLAKPHAQLDHIGVKVKHAAENVAHILATHAHRH